MLITFTAASEDMARRVSFYSMDLPELEGSLAQFGGSTSVKIDIISQIAGGGIMATTDTYISDVGGVYIIFDVVGSFPAASAGRG